ncbi:MAG: sulfite reductase subunit alpha, partial [Planctomycetaceae bacterium]
MEQTVSPAIPMIPPTAPFSPRQRAWLNGFFAGLVSTGKLGSDRPSATPAEGTATAGHASGVIGMPSLNGGVTANGNGVASQAPPSWKDVIQDDPAQYPWHNSELSLEDRMKMADGRPLELKLMAAMAQLDCGQCGYLCRTYSKAIETGEERDLKKCTPGGKATSRLLAKLMQESPSPGQSTTNLGHDVSANGHVDGPASQAVATASATDASRPQLAYSRQNPFPAAAIHVEKLTGDTSSKDTRLITLSISGSELQYKAGDALGVFPKNAKEQVEALLKLFGHDGSLAVRTPEGTSTTFRGALSESCDIKTASDSFLELMIERAPNKEDKKNLQRLLNDEEVPGLIESPRLIDVVARFRDIHLTVDEVVRTLDSLKPRLYSIASSPKVDANQVDLIVGVVQYVLKGQQRRGIASTFLANRMIGHEPVPIFVQPCHHFGLPADPTVPIVMVGPGTGIAPFRSFLHERKALGATGDNWLFFGDQHQATDFLLKDELETMLRDGFLTHLSTAFSRDQAERIYVQHRMLEHGERLWQWLQRGAHFYVCGDASKMAGDVDRALHQI